jgi:hypothetical protein
MPNSVQKIAWNDATTYVHVLGLAQDGSSPTVYVIEPRSNSNLCRCPPHKRPQAIVMDVQADYPAQDRDDLLAIDSAGQIATVDVGNNQFAYRFPGVLVGSLMAVCIYLLARFLFARRSVALIVSLFVLADGMMFANARIAMNDTYVAFFIVAAFTLFVPIWLGRWRNRFAIASGARRSGHLPGPGAGLQMGRRLCHRLCRPADPAALGAGPRHRPHAMIGMTAFLGYIAITPNPDVANPQINYPFLILMLGLTALLAVAIYLRPVRLTRDEMRFTVARPSLVACSSPDSASIE